MSTSEDPANVPAFCRWLAHRWLARRDSDSDDSDSEDDPVPLLLALAPVVLELWFEFVHELAEQHCKGVDPEQRFADILASAGYDPAHRAHPDTAAQRRRKAASRPPGRPSQPPRPSGAR